MTRAILVLGAAMHAPGSPGPALIRRATHAAQLWHKAPAPLILATGGNGEAEAIAEICRRHAVPDACILTETEARNTAENFALSAPLLHARGIFAVTLVTDDYHMPRARLLARRAGIAVAPSAPRHPVGSPHRHLATLLREAAAYLVTLPGLR